MRNSFRHAAIVAGLCAWWAVGCGTSARTEAPQVAPLPATATAPTAAVATPPTRAHLEPQPLVGPTLVATPAGVPVLQRLRVSIDSMVNDPQFRNAHWGILIVDPAAGDTLYEHNADKLFMPASNEKLITTSVGLTQLGRNYLWRTPVELRGVIDVHTFTGDVVVHGRGDPSWSDAMRNGVALSAFAPIADALTTRGITRIVGTITSEDDVFSDVTSGFGWAFDDFDEAYSAPTDELLLNEGFFTLKLYAPKKLANVLTYATVPTRTYPQVIVRAVSRARGDTVGLDNKLVAKWDSSVTSVLVTGTLPMGDSISIEIAYRHPNDAALAGIRQTLTDRGITVVAPVGKRAASTGVKKSNAPGQLRVADTLVVLTSPPLSEVLKRLAKPSQNQIAEMLYKTTAYVATGFGRADSARAVVERQLASWGIPADGFAVRDGSGLSRHDYVAPRTLVRVLGEMQKSPAFPDFYAALPIAGVDGTLSSRMRGTPAANNVHAKTGTVDKARSLSGYVTTADGQLLLFSFLCNNYSVPTRAVERVQDAIATQLASMNLHSARSTP